MIILVGTSHVSEKSRVQVSQAIAHAEIVAIELDHGRAHGLMNGRRATFKELRTALGLKPAIIATLLRGFQEKIGKSLGVVPGLEMKEALLSAKERQLPTMLIDRNVSITIKRLSASFGWKEIKQLMKDFFKRRKIPIDPDNDLVTQLLEEMKTSYPRIYSVMVSERDDYMAHALVDIDKKFPGKTVVAVVGKGHLNGMRTRITHLNPQIEVVIWPSTGTKETQ